MNSDKKQNSSGGPTGHHTQEAADGLRSGKRQSERRNMPTKQSRASQGGADTHTQQVNGGRSSAGLQLGTTDPADTDCSW